MYVLTNLGVAVAQKKKKLAKNSLIFFVKRVKLYSVCYIEKNLINVWLYKSLK